MLSCTACWDVLCAGVEKNGKARHAPPTSQLDRLMKNVTIAQIYSPFNAHFDRPDIKKRGARDSVL